MFDLAEPAAARCRRVAVSILVCVCVVLAGCGGGSAGRMSAQEFQAKGNAICASASRRLHKIGAPTSESQFVPYLKKAIALAESEISQIAALRPPSSYRQPLQDALSESRHEALLFNEFTAKLAGKQVKVSAFEGFSKQLDPLNKRINADYIKAALPECAKEN
jgi:hypothetical protein